MSKALPVRAPPHVTLPPPLAKVAGLRRRGVVSMSHGYGIDLAALDAGADPGAAQPGSMGNHTGALASAEFDYEEPHTGIPRMSSIPVHVTLGPQAG